MKPNLGKSFSRHMAAKSLFATFTPSSTFVENIMLSTLLPFADVVLSWVEGSIAQPPHSRVIASADDAKVS
jgi:hypothetical protein